MDAREHIEVAEGALKRSLDTLTDPATSTLLVQTAIAHALLALAMHGEPIMMTLEKHRNPVYQFGEAQPAFAQPADDIDPDCLLEHPHPGRNCAV